MEISFLYLWTIVVNIHPNFHSNGCNIRWLFLWRKNRVWKKHHSLTLRRYITERATELLSTGCNMWLPVQQLDNNFERIHSIAWNYSHVWSRHYSDDVTMGAIASQISSLAIVYSAVYSGADQRKHPSFPSLAFVRGIHWWPVNSPHKWLITRKMFPFDDVITHRCICNNRLWNTSSRVSSNVVLKKSIEVPMTCSLKWSFWSSCNNVASSKRHWIRFYTSVYFPTSYHIGTRNTRGLSHYGGNVCTLAA